MTPDYTAPVALMMEVRERLVRIETKMDNSAEKVDALQAQTDANTEAISDLKASQRTLKWVGGALVTAATIFADPLMRVFG